MTGRDYDLAGQESAKAVTVGLADADWYRSPISPDLLRQLSERSDGRAAFDALLWVGLLVGSGLTAFLTLGSWVSVPAFIVYWALYGGASDPRWHECGHGTAFRNDTINTLIYYPASFMLFRGPTHWKWSHVRHHSDTIIVGRDAEIVFPRPSSTVRWIIDLTHLISGPKMLAQLGRHALGRLEPGVAGFVPAEEQPKVVREARVALTILVATVVWSLAIWSIVPLLFIGGPTFLGSWLLKFFGTTQHAGLQEDVLDHRFNTRTVLMNPVFRFLYLNMNYHIEHHMFPVVPYHRLPALHDAIKDDLPEPHPNNLSAYRELFGALRAQRADQTWEVPVRMSAAPGGRPMPDIGAGSLERSASSRPVVEALVTSGNDGWVEVRTGHLDEGAIVRVDHGEATYAAYRMASGWYVTDGICTHSRKVHLADGVIVGDQIECPKHNGRFDIASGQPTRAPVCEALGSHVVEATADGFRFHPQS